MDTDDRSQYFVAFLDEQVVTLMSEPFRSFGEALAHLNRLAAERNIDHRIKVVQFEVCS